MSFKAVVTAEEHKALPEAQRGFYKEQDGQWWLDVEPVGTIGLVDHGALKTALSKERASKETAEKALKRFEGMDPEKVRDMERRLAEFADSDPDKKLAAHKKQFEEQLTAKLKGEQDAVFKKAREEGEALTKEREALTRQLDEALVGNALNKAITAHKGTVELLEFPLRQYVRMKRMDDGKHVIRIVDADGQERLSPKPGRNDPMTVDELVEEFKGKSAYARAFEGSGASGSGATGGNGAAGSGNGRFTMKESEVKANVRAYDALVVEARKAGQSVQLVPG